MAVRMKKERERERALCQTNFNEGNPAAQTSNFAGVYVYNKHGVSTKFMF